MESRHNYEYEVNVDANTAAAKVIRFVGHSKRVLEIGAGPGSITKILNGYGNCRVTAIEIDPSAIEKLTSYCERVYQCDLNSPTWPSIVTENGKYQVVVAADVLEHLNDPLSVLRATKQLLTPDGCVVVSLPHVAHHAVIACLLQENFDYQSYGLLDRTHIRFFGIKNIQQLFSDAGFRIVEAEYVVRKPEQTEFSGHWRQLPTDLQKNLDYNKFGMVYQVVVRAKPAPCYENEVILFDLSVPDPDQEAMKNFTLKQRLIYRAKAALLPYMSLRTREKIGDLLIRLGIRV